jgi:hypothetical protein
VNAPDNPNLDVELVPGEEKPGFRPQEPPPPADLRTGWQPPATLEERKAETAKKMAFGLLAILGGSVIVQYVCVMALILTGRDYGAKVLEDLFHSWLPVLSGLAGAAATYYFTKNGK